MTSQRKAVVLFSGGLDSTTCLAVAKRRGFAPYALSFAYGQRHGVLSPTACGYTWYAFFSVILLESL